MKIVRTLLAVTILALFAHEAKAFSVSAGGNFWYDLWKPAWSDGRYSFAYTGPGGTGANYYDLQDMNTESSCLYGPILSVRFLDRFTVSSVFMYGKFDYRSAGVGAGVNLDETLAITRMSVYSRITRHITRWDSDTTAGYSINEYVRALLGLRIQGYRYDESFSMPPLGLAWLKTRSTMETYGMAAGLGTTLPLKWDFYLNASASALILWGFESADLRRSGVSSMYVLDKGRFLAYGGSFAASLEYRITAINTAITAGFRYQLLRYYQRSGTRAYDRLDNAIDRDYGVTVSAVYTFDFGSRQPRAQENPLIKNIDTGKGAR